MGLAVIFWLVVGMVVGAAIGNTRGRSGEGLFLGLLLGPIGWIIVLCLPREGRRCPFCLGVVPDRAVKCLHCSSDLPSDTPATQPQQWVYTVTVECPYCNSGVVIVPHQLTEGCECKQCGRGFVPRPSKLK